ncbi:MAG: dihydrodipicolinate synthase family protein [Sphaerochaetaceae bacterium]|jgi:4-hydroxy-tetrahydrodipicolinate synthase
MNTIENFRGIIPPLVTPIDEQERVLESALRRHIDFVLEGGVSGLLVSGSNGEFYMQEDDEQQEILSIVIDHVAGRVPVYFGIGAIRTKKCIRLAEMGVSMGCSGISVLQPMFIKPSEDELFRHFETIAKSIGPDVPMLLYNNPGRTGYGISQDVVQRLAHEVGNVVGMKDSSGDLTQTEEFIRRNRDVGFRVMCGKDTLIYAGLCIGAVGAVCCTANFLPGLVCSIYNAFVAGDFEASREAQFALNPIRLQMDRSSFPVATKDMGNLLGRDLSRPYLPNLPSTPVQMDGMASVLKNAGYLNS